MIKKYMIKKYMIKIIFYIKKYIKYKKYEIKSMKIIFL